jgi:hypothetical protein
MCLQLPDDGTGALPVLRGVILNDDKSSTYKLALLRSVARIADTAPALAMPRSDEDIVDLPLGLVALNWVRMYLPLVSDQLPQAPGNAGPDGLGFAKTGFRELLASTTVAQDLRIGARFSGSRAVAVARALLEARRTIGEMPAYHIRFPNSNTPIFSATPRSPGKARDDFVIDREMLQSFGSFAVPGHIWRTLLHMGAWIEPVLVSEWARLVRGYAERMGHAVGVGKIEAALTWADPTRDTALARLVARRLMETGHQLVCVWTNVRLTTRAGSLDIDHCLPWSAWPSNDLWNLVPTSSRVNQYLKRDRLPSAGLLAAAREKIACWWQLAWRSDPGLAVRFEREAGATLPVAVGASLDDIFAALEWRRMRLRQDQQIQEWYGAKSPASGSDPTTLQ